MPNVTLMGWDADAKVWRKVLVNADGKLIIDPSEIFEDPPTDGETGKAPNSNWAYDHNANASAHHAKYTDAEAVASFGSRNATLTTGTYTDYDVSDINMIFCDTSGGNILLKGLTGGVSGQMIFFIKTNYNYKIQVLHESTDAASGDRIRTTSLGTQTIASGNYGSFILIYDGSYWNLIYQFLFKWTDYFTNTPVDGDFIHGPTANWAYDHKLDAGAHSILDDLSVNNVLAAGNGVSGTFTTADGKTVTVTDGIITSIV